MLATVGAEPRVHHEHHTLRELRRALGHELESLEAELAGFIAAGPAAGTPPGEARVVSAVEREIQKRIAACGQLLAGLQGLTPAMIPEDGVGYGSIVFVRDLTTGEETEYSLVAGDLIDVDANQVSMESPVGRALLGSRRGDEVSVLAPSRVVRLRVLAVHTLHERLGLR